MAETVRKNLGMVTAYAYAVSKGYTGTEEEFAELMASYADVAQDAEASAQAAAQSATTAEQKATQAAGSATNAAVSATSASESAQAAAGSSNNASLYAQNASASATNAAGSASSASTYAGNASASAQDAEGSANDAQTSATQAAGSATTATAKAGEAATSATTAVEAAQRAEGAAATLVIDDTLTHAGQAADAKKTGDEIGELKEKLEEVTGPDKNLLYYYDWSRAGASIALNSNDITITATSASTYRSASVDIPVNDSNFMVLSYLSKSASVESTTSARIRYGSVVDGTNTWLGYITSSPTVINTSNITTLKLALYVDTAAVAVGDYAVFTQLQLEYGESASSFSFKSLNAVDDVLRRKVSELTNEIPLILADSISTVGANKYNPDTRIVGFIANDTGAINPNADYFTSDFIDVSEFTNGYAFTPKARKILFYDAYKNAITASYYNNETAAGVIEIDATYKYVRMSWYRSSTNVMVADSTTLPPYVPYEIIAKDGINYLNSDTKAKIQQMVGEGGKSSQIASFLNGKTVAIFGDSIMYGAGSSGSGVGDILAQKYGMNLEKYCVSGATMGVRTDDPSYTVDEVHHIAKQVRNAIAANIAPDIIIFGGGTNDIGGNITIGTMSEVYTEPSSESYFADGFETVAYLLTKNFVGVPIIYMRAHNMSSRSYQDQIDYGELGNKIAEKWGIRTVDMYKRMNTQLAEYRTAYLADYTHPNAAGYNKYYIPAIEDFVFNELIN